MSQVKLPLCALGIPSRYMSTDQYDHRLADIQVLLHLDAKIARTRELHKFLEEEVDFQKIQTYNKELKQLESLIDRFDQLNKDLEALKLLIMEYGEYQLQNEILAFDKILVEFEQCILFDGAQDAEDSFMDIKAGSGGLEAQDWAAILMRMYMKWALSKNLQATILDIGEEAEGIRHCTIEIKGKFSYGLLQGEHGVHRLVRKSPFDPSGGRHTSFASVFVYPVLEQNIDIGIQNSDLRIDTFRSSGAGGQHVNKTDSAVRITHLPTNVTVQCQSDRSQHKNREIALKQLKQKLYMLALEAEKKKTQVLEASKSDITWGQQIRSYVLDKSVIKDLRTHIAVRDTRSVLEGNIDVFINAYLKYRKYGSSK